MRPKWKTFKWWRQLDLMKMTWQPVRTTKQSDITQEWHNSNNDNRWMWTWNHWKWYDNTFNQNVWGTKAMKENFKWRRQMNSVKMINSTWNLNVWRKKLMMLKVIQTKKTGEWKHWFTEPTVIWLYIATKMSDGRQRCWNFQLMIDECKLGCQ